MIIRLKIQLLSGAYAPSWDWIREIEIDQDTILLNLHDVIQGLADFDDDHMFEFFLGRNQFNHRIIFDPEEETAYAKPSLELKREQDDMIRKSFQSDDSKDLQHLLSSLPSNPFPDKTLEEITIADALTLKTGKLKLFYYFDFGDSWYFQINKTRHKPREPEDGVKYPRVIAAEGKNFDQYPSFEE
jgi:hypothetical protein